MGPLQKAYLLTTHKRQPATVICPKSPCIIIKEVVYTTTQIRNPKRGKESRIGRASWYDYYAGFSTTFVQDLRRSPEVTHLCSPEMTQAF
jgi:hypothetical protein